MKVSFIALLPWVLTAAIPNELASVIEMARHAPGEFSSDALIRIASAGKLDKEVRVQLLEEAFRRAAEAQQPFKRRASILRVSGPAGFLQHAYQQNLDGLSLRLRAIDALLPLDKVKARNLFLEIPPLQLPKLTCEDYLVYDVGYYYDVLGKVARQSFGPKEVADGEPARFLERYTTSISSSSQVAPAARLLAAAGLRKQDFENLLPALSGSLGHIYGDDRSFTASVSEASEQISGLADHARGLGASPLVLLEGYRRYLVNNLAGERCADDDLMQGAPTSSLGNATAPGGLSTAAINYFNQKLAKPPILPLTEDEVTPSRVQGAAAGLRSCQDEECKQLATQYQGLIFNANGTPVSQADRDAAEWHTRLQDLLNAMANWKESGGAADLEQFRDKCALFGLLLGVIPPGPDREHVLMAWLDYLDGNRMEQDDRMSWFLPVNTMVGRVALDPPGLGKLSDALRKARNPVIALYMELERVLPRTPDQIMPLM